MIVYHRVTHGIQGDSNMPPNTDLISRAHAFGKKVPYSYAPAVFDKVFFRNDFRKYTMSYNWCPDLVAYNLATQALRFRYQPHLHSADISFEEAIRRMDKTKSPGFPWNLNYKTKQEVLDNEYELLKSIHTMIMNGTAIRFYFLGKLYDGLYWQTSPKEEFRPLEKIINPNPEDRKTRVFLAGEIIMQIISIQLFGEQNDSLLASHRQGLWIQVGFTPFYGGWNGLATHLLHNSDRLTAKFNCWDFKHMESSLKEHILIALYKMRLEFILLSHVSHAGVKWICQQIIYSLIIDVDGFLCLMFGCNPSGGFNTLLDNCFGCELVWLYTLAKLCSNLQELVAKASQHHCAVLGDDSIVPAHIDFANIIEDAQELGFEIKPEALDVVLSDSIFLNNSFLYINNVFVPKPNFEKLRANIYWHFKKHSWRLCYVKVCAYRVLAWNFPDFRNEAELILVYIIKNYDQLMQSEVNELVSYYSARAAYLPAAQIDFMWFGNERAITVQHNLQLHQFDRTLHFAFTL